MYVYTKTMYKDIQQEFTDSLKCNACKVILVTQKTNEIEHF